MEDKFSKLLISSNINPNTKLDRHDDYDVCWSQLPEEIIHQIVSASGLQVRQWSMLSKTFLQYFKTYPKLSFTVSNEKNRRKADATLERYNQQQLSITKFRLEVLLYHSRSISSINRWLDVTINNKDLRDLELYIVSNRTDISYNIPISIFSAKNLTRLVINGDTHKQTVSIDYDEFNCNKLNFELGSLKTMRLFSLTIDSRLLQKLISNCRNIETLSLNNLDSPGFKKIEVYGFEKIKKLFIRYFRELSYVDIKNAPNLETVSITYKDYFPQVDFVCAAKLKSVNFEKGISV